MHTGEMLLALVSCLKGILGCPLSSVTLAIRCMEEDNQPLSLLDLERLGKPSQSLVFGGRAFTHQRKMDVPYSRQEIWYKDICPIMMQDSSPDGVSLTVFVQTKCFP